jgi:hypothetical protein
MISFPIAFKFWAYAGIVVVRYLADGKGLEGNPGRQMVESRLAPPKPPFDASGGRSKRAAQVGVTRSRRKPLKRLVSDSLITSTTVSAGGLPIRSSGSPS